MPDLTETKRRNNAQRNARFRDKWRKLGLCWSCSEHEPVYKGARCLVCYRKAQKLTKKAQRKREESTKAKLSERKTVHEWLNNLGIPSAEFGKDICLLRRLRILCDRYRYYANVMEAQDERTSDRKVRTAYLETLKPHKDGQE